MPDVALASPEFAAEGPVAVVPTTFREVPWRGRDLVIGLAPLVVERVGAVLVPGELVARLPAWSWIVGTVVGMAWALGYPLWLVHRHHGSIRWPRPRALLVNGLIALLLLPVLFGLLMLVSIAWRNLGLGSTTATTALDVIARSPNRYETWALALFAILVAPVAEEVFYRGFVYNALRRRLPVLLAVVVQAVLFGFLHPFNLLGMVTIAVGGCVLGLVYEWRKTLVASIGLHGFQNAAGMLMITAAATAYAATPVMGVVAVPHAGGDIITQVVPQGAAEQAGLRVGDVVTAINGAAFPTGGLAEVVRSFQVGDEITVQYLREGKPSEVQVPLNKRAE